MEPSIGEPASICTSGADDLHPRPGIRLSPEAMLREIAGTIQEVFWLSSPDLETLFYVNPAFERVWGLPCDSAGHFPAAIFHAAHPEDRPRVLQEFQKASRASLKLEYRIVKPDGSIHWVVNTAHPVLDETGRTVMLAGAASDITRCKLLEKESLHIQAQLQQAQKMEAIGTLAGGIAHDFNNILSAVLGYTEIALMESEQGESVRRNLREVLQAVERARKLVRQILTFSRRNDQEFKPVRLNLLIREALGLIRASLPATIRIASRLTSDSAILADPTQIHQLILNLCTNAAHAMRATGGGLFIETEDVIPCSRFFKVHPGLNPGPYLKLSIRDTGCGIPAAVLPRIFEPFFTTKARSEGTGMGLAVVMGIVQSHKGAVDVQSAVGQGTRFDVFMPIIASNDAGDVLLPDAAAPTGRERILLVDDETILVELGERMLSRLGYRVTACSSSDEGLRLFTADPFRFDLVITDLTMPAMTGDRLAKQLIAVRPDIPIILCSGYSEQISREEARAFGIKEYVLKPISLCHLANAVRRVLDGS